MKMHWLPALVLVACSRVPEPDQVAASSRTSASLSLPASSDAPIIRPRAAGVPTTRRELPHADAVGFVSHVEPPTNAPTEPGTPTPTVADLQRARDDIGSSLQQPASTQRSASRDGRGIAECGQGKNMGCRSNADCGAGDACVCEPLGGYSNCVPATCRVDADCDGGACVEALERQAADLTCATAHIALHCASLGDECKPGAGSCGDASDRSCIFDTDSGRFLCAPLCSELPMMQERVD
jgi:hypothetical protein